MAVDASVGAVSTVGFLVVVVIFVALAVLGGRYGADSRLRDPRQVEQQWPFFRHRS